MVETMIAILKMGRWSYFALLVIVLLLFFFFLRIICSIHLLLGNKKYIRTVIYMLNTNQIIKVNITIIFYSKCYKI